MRPGWDDVKLFCLAGIGYLMPPACCRHALLRASRFPATRGVIKCQPGFPFSSGDIYFCALWCDDATIPRKYEHALLYWNRDFRGWRAGSPVNEHAASRYRCAPRLLPLDAILAVKRHEKAIIARFPRLYEILYSTEILRDAKLYFTISETDWGYDISLNFKWHYFEILQKSR